MEIIRKRNLGTIGRCIYCGAISGRLDKEHIVPYGLNGEWTLGKASCTKCAKTISKIELQILHIELSEARAALDFRTRHKDKRPGLFPILFGREGKEEVIYVPLLEHLSILPLPIFSLPAYIDQRNYNKGIDICGHTLAQVAGPSPKQIASKYGADTLILKSTTEPFAFARLLAKIAYGFSVATYGTGIIEKAYVRPAILGKSDDVGRWVGCPTNSLTPQGNYLHEIRLSVKNGEIYGYVRLFAKFAAPEYLVIVGCTPAPQVSTFEDTLFIC